MSTSPKNKYKYQDKEEKLIIEKIQKHIEIYRNDPKPIFNELQELHFPNRSANAIRKKFERLATDDKRLKALGYKEEDVQLLRSLVKKSTTTDGDGDSDAEVNMQAMVQRNESRKRRQEAEEKRVEEVVEQARRASKYKKKAEELEEQVKVLNVEKEKAKEEERKLKRVIEEKKEEERKWQRERDRKKKEEEKLKKEMDELKEELEKKKEELSQEKIESERFRRLYACIDKGMKEVHVPVLQAKPPGPLQLEVPHKRRK